MKATTKEKSVRPQAEVSPAAERLTELFDEARAAIASFEAAEKTARKHAHQAGKALAEAKALVGHGGWIKRLKAEGIPQQSAWRYMAYFEATKSLTVGDLPPIVETIRNDTSDPTEADINDAKRRMKEKYPPEEELSPSDLLSKEELLALKDRMREIVTTGYRALALKHHPDRGGVPAEMVRTTQARNGLGKLIDHAEEIARVCINNARRKEYE
jgi:hypothetical protein